MSNNKYLLGTTIAVFLAMGMTLIAFQAIKSNDFVAYAQTDSKKMSDSKQANAEQLFKDQQFRQQVIDVMKKNHDIAQDIITAMINDPTLRLQLIGHLTESKAAMQDLTNLFGQNGTNMKMGSGTTDHNSMSMKKDSMKKETSARVDFSNVKITNISANSATIQGTTNQSVNCQVEYWTAKDPKHYFASDTGDMMDMKHTDHKVTIKDLMPNTKYSYKFKATLDGKTFYSSQKTFTTKAA